jgi:hypothetical protein
MQYKRRPSSDALHRLFQFVVRRLNVPHRADLTSFMSLPRTLGFFSRILAHSQDFVTWQCGQEPPRVYKMDVHPLRVHAETEGAIEYTASSTTYYMLHASLHMFLGIHTPTSQRV